MLNFFRRNWIALLSLTLAASAGAAIVYTPALLATLAGVSVAASTPFAFLANFTPMVAAAIVASSIAGFGLILNGIAGLFRSSAVEAPRVPVVQNIKIDIDEDDIEENDDVEDLIMLQRTHTAAADATTTTASAAPSPHAAARNLGMFATPAAVHATDEDLAVSCAP